MPLLAALAQVAHWFPGLAIRSGWPTRSGVIPWRLFWALYKQLPTPMAMQRLNTVEGVGLAVANAFADPKKPAAQADLKRAMKRMRAQAFPGVFRGEE